MATFCLHSCGDGVDDVKSGEVRCRKVQYYCGFRAFGHQLCKVGIEAKTALSEHINADFRRGV